MINERLEDYLSPKLEKPKEREPGVYYASELSFDPHEIESFRKMQVDMRLLKIFEVGNIFHNFVQQTLFSDAEHEVRIEYKLNNNIKIIGRADIVHKDVIIEIKTTSYKMTVPKDNHIAQLTFYLHAFNKKRGKLVYINKNNFEIYEFDIVYVKSFWEDLENAIKKHYELYK